jgi:hypothetical protein
LDTIEAASVANLLRGGLTLLRVGSTRLPATTYGRVDPAELVLGVLLSSANRKGSLARAQLDRQRTVLLHTLRRHTALGRPVELTVMAFPFKAPNPLKVGARRLPDLAEYAAINRLDQLRQAVRAVYEPGLRLHVILDGAELAPIVGIATDEAHAYAHYLRGLMRDGGVADFVETHDFTALLEEGPWDITAERRRLNRVARRQHDALAGSAAWIGDFRRMLGMINLRHMPVDKVSHVVAQARHGRLAPEHAELEARVHAAMVEYRTFDLLIHELDPRARHFPLAIHATTQERPGRLALWIVQRGRSHLPWHGVGAVDERGKVRIGPWSEFAAAGGYEPVCLTGEETPFLYRRSPAA